MKKINEIFYSLQGEGFYTGTAAIFIRFSGCNLHCPFCDTQHENGSMMTDEEILAQVSQYPGRHVVLTGGEPSLFVSADFVEQLHALGKYVAIETNGTCVLPPNIDWITCSPKEGGTLAIHAANELKVVFVNQDMAQYDDFKAENRFLQPCSGQNTAEVVAYIKQHPQWRLSLQTHKFLGIR